jgi:hypothetical protein
MPTVLDATVVASAYSTSASARPIKLNDGTLMSILLDGSGLLKPYKSTDNGLNWSALSSPTGNSLGALSVVTNGNNTYIIGSVANTNTYFAVIKKDGTLLQSGNIIADNTALGNVSLAINDTGTELHATWSSKNATYANSFNIRYAKGTINADGSVTWGAVEQVSVDNTAGRDHKNPTIILRADGKPIIIEERVYPSNNFITVFSKATGSWVMSVDIYAGTTYAQSSPSAIFVPQSINGLANGRIWVAWHGTDATDTAKNNIRVSYSDDGGATWSAMQKLTSGNTTRQEYPSVTANKANTVFVVWDGDPYGYGRMKTFSAGVWSTESVIANIQANRISTLFDPTFSFGFTSPLFITQKFGVSVSFYGTWTVTTISVVQGSIGQKTERTNLLTYVITTDGTMSTITEKVNGTVTGTKTATSGQSLIAGVTQAQWDAIKYGKYNNPVTVTSDVISLTSTDWTLGNSWTSASGVGSAIAVSASQIYQARLTNYVTNFNEREYVVSVGGGYTINVLEGDANGILLKATYDLVDGNKFTALSTTKRIYIHLRKIDATTITSANVQTASPKMINSQTTFPNNTLTVEMGTDVFTYTFDKRPATDADILSATKAIQDSQNTYLPAVKSKLGSAIRGKGGTVNDTDSFEVMASALSVVSSGRKANGTSTSSGGILTFTYPNGSGVGVNYLTVTGLSFKPSSISIVPTTAGLAWVTNLQSVELPRSSSPYGIITMAQYSPDSLNGGVTTFNISLTGNAVVSATGFTLPVNTASTSFKWFAYE